MKIIIVDDNKDVTYSLKKSLESLGKGYECREAYSGIECLELVKKDKPDLVLLDIMMPKMDGWAVAEALEPLKIPVIYITGKANMVQEARKRKIDFLMKPIDMKELDNKIQEIMKMWVI